MISLNIELNNSALIKTKNEKSVLFPVNYPSHDTKK